VSCCGNWAVLRAAYACAVHMEMVTVVMTYPYGGDIITARLGSHCTHATTNTAIGRNGSTWRTARHIRVESAVLVANCTRQAMYCDVTTRGFRFCAAWSLVEWS